MTGVFTLGALGLSLSVDAFAAAVGKGASDNRYRVIHALKVGAVFGTFAAIMPAIGWAMGLAFNAWIAKVDHWVAFVLLLVIGAQMLRQAGKPRPAETRMLMPPKPQGVVQLATTAFATSIDTLAVGVSLKALNANIALACLIIGGVTTVVATLGVLVGKQAGSRLGRNAEVLGGMALITVGSLILYQHLTTAAGGA